MTDIMGVLGQSAPSAGSLTTAYTVPSSTWARVHSVVVCNRSNQPTRYRIAVSPGGASIANSHYQWYDKVIDGNDTKVETFGPLGIGLEATDLIRVWAYDATVSFSVHGYEYQADTPVGSLTPTLVCSTTDPTVTYGADRVLYYVKDGPLVQFWMFITLATVSAAGSGYYLVALPFGRDAAMVNYNTIGSGNVYTGGADHPCEISLYGSNDQFRWIGPQASIGNVSDSSITLAAGNAFTAQGQFLTDA